MIYLDSCLVIYLVEKNKSYYHQVKSAIASADAAIVSSPLVKMECLVGAFKRQDLQLQAEFKEFFESVINLALTDEVFTLAAKKRAEYRVKTPDALHLATAEYHGCSAFWTNDNRLAKVSPIAKNVY